MRLGLGPGKTLKQKLGGGSTPASVPDLTPSAFTFTDVAAVAVSTVQTSNSVTPTGYDTATAVTITGGEYEFDNSGVWTSSAGTISPGQSVRVRHTASASGGTATNTVLTIGGVSDTFTSTTLSGTITTPVITQTSSAGASPLLFTASLNTSDTYAGYIFRVQVAANTSSDFTTTTQDISHTLTESEITSGDIDITTDGFVTPPGAFSLRVRIERDDGVTSAYSNVITGTTTSATAQWAGTNGFDKHNLVTVSGTPRLSVTGSSAGYAYVRSTQSATPNEFVFEFTLGSVIDSRIGMDDRAIDFTSYSGFPGGFSDSGFYIVPGSSEVWYMAGGGATNVSFGVAMATGDIIAVVGNKTSGVVKFERWRSGVKTQLGSAGGYTLAGMASWYIYHGSNAGGNGTLNTGQSAFAHTLTGSEAAFG